MTPTFDDYIESTIPYIAAIETAADQHRGECLDCQSGTDCPRCPAPWHKGDIESRRELFMRRYIRPEAPEGMSPIKSIRSYQRTTNDQATQTIRSGTSQARGAGAPAQAA